MQADGGPLAQDPLHGHDTYETVRAPIAPRSRSSPAPRRPPAAAAARRPTAPTDSLALLAAALTSTATLPSLSRHQVKFLNRGAYGVVVLARERATGREWALKFIERGPLVSGCWVVVVGWL
jgi:hypothetical protein